MNDLVEQIEDRRLALGLSQRAVADRLSISQPHYSKLVGGLVRLTPAMAEAMTAWLNDAVPSPAAPPARSSRIRTLTRSIERQLRELNSLLTEDGVTGGRRPPRRVRRQQIVDR